MHAPLPESEASRLRTLQMYQILDTATERSFEDLTKLAATICDVPISLISLVDENRQWFKSRVGLDAPETSRESSFCAHAILKQDEIMVVPDAMSDNRFADNPLVTGDPNIRFYAGAPLNVANGESLGTLCVIDRKPRVLTDQQREALSVLREAVVNQLELRRAMGDIDFLSRCMSMCAWCRSVRLSNGTWRTANDYLEDTNRVTHGICPDCQSTQMAAMPKVKSRQPVGR